MATIESELQTPPVVLRGPACRRACADCLEPEEWRPTDPPDRECRLPLRVVMDPLDACVVTESFDARTEAMPAHGGQTARSRSAVVVCVCPREAPKVLEVVARGGERRAGIRVLPESFGLAYRLRPALGLHEVPVYEPPAGVRRRASLGWKRASDVAVAAVLLVLLLPLLALVAVVIRLESRERSSSRKTASAGAGASSECSSSGRWSRTPTSRRRDS